MAADRIQSPKGVKDVLPAEQPYWARTEATIRELTRLYGYERLDLPIFEETRLFQRGVGQGTDIVEKEMYTFMDKGDKSMTLRPEFTAGVMRAYLQHSMSQLPQPVKVWSMGPVFRYERPQAGRFRQHTQFNVEALGESDPALDFEIMSIAYHLYETLGFKDLNFQINSIGCSECRPAYLKRLIQYYRYKEDIICRDCRSRLETNPLRLLDCKQEECQQIIKDAPSIAESLCPDCRDHFETLLRYLNLMGRPYTLNYRLVRGLDYYTRTVFEVWAQGIGSQNAVCGGGRYDGLSEALGGPPTPGVGFASGLERIVMTLQAQQEERLQATVLPVFFVLQDESARETVVTLVNQLRGDGIPCGMAFGDRSLKAQLREANKREALFSVIMGADEINRREAAVKEMKEGGSQENVAWDNLTHYIKERLT